MMDDEIISLGSVDSPRSGMDEEYELPRNHSATFCYSEWIENPGLIPEAFNSEEKRRTAYGFRLKDHEACSHVLAHFRYVSQEGILRDNFDSVISNYVACPTSADLEKQLIRVLDTIFNERRRPTLEYVVTSETIVFWMLHVRFPVPLDAPLLDAHFHIAVHDECANFYLMKHRHVLFPQDNRLVDTLGKIDYRVERSIHSIVGNICHFIETMEELEAVVRFIRCQAKQFGEKYILSFPYAVTDHAIGLGDAVHGDAVVNMLVRLHQTLSDPDNIAFLELLIQEAEDNNFGSYPNGTLCMMDLCDLYHKTKLKQVMSWCPEWYLGEDVIDIITKQCEEEVHTIPKQPIIIHPPVYSFLPIY